jgi:hypothetical protein
MLINSVFTSRLWVFCCGIGRHLGEHVKSKTDFTTVHARRWRSSLIGRLHTLKSGRPGGYRCSKHKTGLVGLQDVPSGVPDLESVVIGIGLVVLEGVLSSLAVTSKLDITARLESVY